MEAKQGVPVAERPAPEPVATAPCGHGVAPAPRSRKGGARPAPERREALAHLTLDRLRDYRRALADEENRVSYWRRILQARLDVLRAGFDGGTARTVDTEALRPVLTDARVGAGRQALVEIVPIDDIPPLPRLQELWAREVEPTDLDAARGLEADLTQAEHDLSEYRAALHRRITDATGELIARYSEQPSLCLSALPLPPVRQAG